MASATNQTAIAATGWFSRRRPHSWAHADDAGAGCGIGVAVFLTYSQSQVPPTLTWYIIDRHERSSRLARKRFRKQRESVARFQADKKGTREGRLATGYASGARTRGLCRRLSIRLRRDVDQELVGLDWSGAACRDNGAPPL
jgi:hypothetical protein